MKKNTIMLSISVALLLAMVGAAKADICLWQQQLDPATAVGIRSTLPTNRLADDWQWMGSQPINAIEWWGTYRNWGQAAAPLATTPEFELTIWTNNPWGIHHFFPQPRNVLWRRAVRPTESYNGVDDLLQETRFKYSIALPEADWFTYPDSQPTTLWLSIAAVGPLPAGLTGNYTWCWDSTPDGADHWGGWAVSSTDGYVWDPAMMHHEYVDTAFALKAVPVPGALWLLGSGLAALVGRYRRTKSLDAR
ncbi:MAG: hypothetical protein V2A77_08030 [Pseudomonadota bacterium]